MEIPLSRSAISVPVGDRGPQGRPVSRGCSKIFLSSVIFPITPQNPQRNNIPRAEKRRLTAAE
ncbi:hypothetical protein [Sphingopyxis flava]|uniref:hypothetical protein n=1 Tax=Sphingopyxis flava TaxID=1507287 RepID=UPI0015916544|nr:hypothetical protein [Sphingopyxis flava]